VAHGREQGDFPVGLYLLIAFIGIPLVEIGLLIQVGSVIGTLPTLAIIIVTAIVGAYMVRAQGLATAQSARRTLSQGQVPLAEVFDGVCLFASGMLLLTPGFVTDSVGGLLLVPLFRQWLRGMLVRRLLDTALGPDDGGPNRQDRAIDADYTVVDRQVGPNNDDQ
jgi:UPF0716 protein FxsA